MKPSDFDKALRSALKADPRSDNELAREAKVPQTVVSRVRNHGAGTTWDTAAKLCAALGLELKPSARTNKG